MRFLLAALIAALLCASGESFAQSQSRIPYSNSSTGSRKLLAGVALNAAAGTRTFTLFVGGRNTLSIQTNLTRVAATTLTMSCKASLDGGTTYADIMDQIVTTGLGTLAPHVWSRDTSVAPCSGGSCGIIYDLSVGTYDYIQCVLGGAAAGASDLVDVYAIGGAGL